MPLLTKCASIIKRPQRQHFCIHWKNKLKEIKLPKVVSENSSDAVPHTVQAPCTSYLYRHFSQVLSDRWWTGPNLRSLSHYHNISFCKQPDNADVYTSVLLTSHAAALFMEGTAMQTWATP